MKSVHILICKEDFCNSVEIKLTQSTNIDQLKKKVLLYI